MDLLERLNPLGQTLILTAFTWGVTALGAATVFAFKTVSRAILDLMLSFGAGVMLAASFWSLLLPAIELCHQLGYSAWLTPAAGFLTGGLFIVAADLIFDKCNIGSSCRRDCGSMRRCLLLVLAITIHNVPEGMAVGVAFAGVSMGLPGSTLMGAVLLGIGIGLQNFPEGASVSLPLRREGLNPWKSFWYGQLSGAVEPLAGLVGAAAALSVRGLLPFLLTFSAGAMVAVVVGELVPESATADKNRTVVGVVLGFILMMILDVALG
jgi:ZIP family zinc transporter